MPFWEDFLVYRSPPCTHQACNQEAGLQLQVAGNKNPGVECCRSPRVSSQKKKKAAVWECPDAFLCAAFLQIISTGGVGVCGRSKD